MWQLGGVEAMGEIGIDLQKRDQPISDGSSYPLSSTELTERWF
jgi:hypothetical protein